MTDGTCHIFSQNTNSLSIIIDIVTLMMTELSDHTELSIKMHKCCPINQTLTFNELIETPEAKMTNKSKIYQLI